MQWTNPVKHRPYRPWDLLLGGKLCKPPHSYAVDKRAIIVWAGYNLSSAGDNQQQYRPQESPAKRQVIYCAGVTGGILRGLAIVDLRLISWSDDQGTPQSRLKRR